MGKLVLSLILCIIMSLLISSAYAKKNQKRELPPAHAPAPLENVNLTHLLLYAGNFHIFLANLTARNLIPYIESKANSRGVTVFVPTDSAFESLNPSALSRLTEPQFRSLMLFHVLQKSLSITNLMAMNTSVSTLAGNSSNGYGLSFKNNGQNISIDTGVENVTETSSVSTNPTLSLYSINGVLLPVRLFGGKKIPLAPAPAIAPMTRKSNHTKSPSPLSASPFPSPPLSPAADSVSPSSPSSCYRCFGWSVGEYLVLLGALVLVL